VLKLIDGASSYTATVCVTISSCLEMIITVGEFFVNIVSDAEAAV